MPAPCTGTTRPKCPQAEATRDLTGHCPEHSSQRDHTPRQRISSKAGDPPQAPPHDASDRHSRTRTRHASTAITDSPRR